MLHVNTHSKTTLSHQQRFVSVLHTMIAQNGLRLVYVIAQIVHSGLCTCACTSVYLCACTFVCLCAYTGMHVQDSNTKRNRHARVCCVSIFLSGSC